ncbi:MAG: GNAT family N-acetyltransferase [Bacteroidetes bacterium]|jgi:ribosomal-protein-alanine N-acetyltransferase|nr:GNAT family N-acetyltransferase [Bacteroidota bacterium]MBK8329779.1 GNAT family N-acetyltransferase [Bacteroidota bacterium]MBK9481689.1 GNAT family N-acetyltransferase [Bacteroidota bacterium]
MKLKPIIIETQRLKLTGYSSQDMTFIFENFSREEIKIILGHRTDEDYQIEEYKYKNGYASYNRAFILFLLTEKITNTIIGRCGLHNWHKEHHRAEIGYNISDENFKRKGLMNEAVSSIIDYGFNELNLHRIEALVGSNNIPSLKIIESHHFTKEGLLRQHYFVADKFEDSVVYSILYNEYIDNKIDKTTNS